MTVDPATLMNLYLATLPGARLTVTSHNGLLAVYLEAPSATALLVSQLPRAATSPDLQVRARWHRVSLRLFLARPPQSELRTANPARAWTRAGGWDVTRQQRDFLGGGRGDKSAYSLIVVP